MNPRAVRPLALAAALLFLLGLLGLATVDERATTRLTRIAAATKAKGTARIAMVFSSSGPTPASSDGVVDLRAGRALVTVRTPWLGAPAELLADGDTTYVGTAAYPHLHVLAGGKRWIVWESVTVATGPGLGSNLAGDEGNPVRWLRLLENGRVAGDVREEGAADVRGESTTRYTGELDLTELLRAVGSGQALALVNQVRSRAGEIEVWVGDDGALRRMVVRVPIPGYGITVTVELHDFGVAADIVPPPPDQVHRIAG